MGNYLWQLLVSKLIVLKISISFEFPFLLYIIVSTVCVSFCAKGFLKKKAGGGFGF